MKRIDQKLRTTNPCTGWHVWPQIYFGCQNNAHNKCAIHVWYSPAWCIKLYFHHLPAWSLKFYDVERNCYVSTECDSHYCMRGVVSHTMRHGIQHRSVARAQKMCGLKACQMRISCIFQAQFFNPGDISTACPLNLCHADKPRWCKK